MRDFDLRTSQGVKYQGFDIMMDVKRSWKLQIPSLDMRVFGIPTMIA